ncbi:MAG: twin-arginine translocation signal domain-containing protein, partial [Streptosporangiaceae bacterium]
MNDHKLPSLSRRGFLVGAAGVAAAAMLPSSSTSAVKAAVTPLAGATIAPPTVYNTKNSVTA